MLKHPTALAAHDGLPVLASAQENEQKMHRRQGAGDAADAPEQSPFAAISATMGWETFHMVQSLWLGIIDLPAAAQAVPGEKWDLQVNCPCAPLWTTGGRPCTTAIYLIL